MNPLPPLNPLKVFEVVGRLLSVSKAADELCVTPAAVSRQVRTLEDFLGVQLFHRAHGGLELTESGSRYLSEVMPLLAALRESTNVVMQGSYRRHTLRIRSPATFAVRWLIPRLASFHQRHPDIDVRVTTSSAALDFQREDIDAGIQLGDGDWPQWRVQRLIPNVLVPALAPSRHPAGGPLAREALAHETLLHSLARMDDWSLWLSSAGVDHVNAYRGMKYETSLLSYQAAIEGHGVVVAQQALIARELEAGTLVAPFDFRLDRGAFTYYFASPGEREEPAALAAFARWLAGAVGKDALAG